MLSGVSTILLTIFLFLYKFKFIPLKCWPYFDTFYSMVWYTNDRSLVETDNYRLSDWQRLITTWISLILASLTKQTLLLLAGIDKTGIEIKNTKTFTFHLSSPFFWVDIYFTKRGKFKKGISPSYVTGNIFVTSSKTLPCSLTSSIVE